MKAIRHLGVWACFMLHFVAAAAPPQTLEARTIPANFSPIAMLISVLALWFIVKFLRMKLRKKPARRIIPITTPTVLDHVMKEVGPLQSTGPDMQTAIRLIEAKDHVETYLIVAQVDKRPLHAAHEAALAELRQKHRRLVKWMLWVMGAMMAYILLMQWLLF